MNWKEGEGMIHWPSWLSSPALRKRAILTTVLIVILFTILVSAWTALLPFFMGSVLAYILLPLVNYIDNHTPKFMRRTPWSRPLAILLVYIIGIALMAGVIAYFVPVVRNQGQYFIDQVLPNYFERLQRIMTYDFSALLAQIPPEIQTTVNTSLERAAATVLSTIQRAIEVTITTVSQTISFILGLVIVPIWLFYVLNDEQKIRRGVLQWVPEGAREDVRCILALMDDLLGSYIRGQIILSLIVGIMSTIVLLIFQIDLAILLGTFAGIFEVIPILGPYIGALPAVLIALLKRPILALWVALAFWGIQQVENLFLVPRIAGAAVRFHPALVMIIIVVGSQVAGLLGIFMAVPLSAMARDIFKYLYLRTTESGATPQMALESVRASSVKRKPKPGSSVGNESKVPGSHDVQPHP
jgi:predicted PurR-regulated permease PerM